MANTATSGLPNRATVAGTDEIALIVPGTPAVDWRTPLSALATLIAGGLASAVAITGGTLKNIGGMTVTNAFTSVGLTGAGLKFSGGSTGVIIAYDFTNALYQTLATYANVASFYCGSTTSPVLKLLLDVDGVKVRNASLIYEAEGSVASAAMTSLESVLSDRVLVTGSTGPITGFGTGVVGMNKIVRFSGTLSITHSTAIICPWAEDLAIVPGAMVWAVCEAMNVWRIVSYSMDPRTIVDVFMGSGTWTKRTVLVSVEVHVFGGGGGGGGGGKAASGTAVSGGGGGGGGAHAVARFLAADLGSTEAVTVGAAGTGGAGSTVNNTQATSGTAGGTSDFAGSVFAYGGGFGFGGDDAANAGGGGGATIYGAGGNGSTSGGNAGIGAGAAAGAASSNGTAATTYGSGGAGAAAAGSSPQGGGHGGPFGGAGGAAGGGVTTAPAASAGGQGRPGPGTDAATLLTGGTTGGGAGQTHSPTTTTQLRAGGGGSGGGSSTTTNGGAGGAGQTPSGGGAGGGASISNNGGSGGAGGAGLVVVVNYF